jgi:hypothetical protein
VELSRVVVLGSRPVEGDTINKLKRESNFITKKVHLEGQGRYTSEVARTQRPPTA